MPKKAINFQSIFLGNYVIDFFHQVLSRQPFTERVLFKRKIIIFLRSNLNRLKLRKLPLVFTYAGFETHNSPNVSPWFFCISVSIDSSFFEERLLTRRTNGFMLCRNPDTRQMTKITEHLTDLDTRSFIFVTICFNTANVSIKCFSMQGVFLEKQSYFPSFRTLTGRKCLLAPQTWKFRKMSTFLILSEIFCNFFRIEMSSNNCFFGCHRWTDPSLKTGELASERYLEIICFHL